MTLNKALRIQELRAGKTMHSARRIAEIIEDEYPEYPELRGNQIYGQELMNDALMIIYNVDNFMDIDDDVLEKWGL